MADELEREEMQEERQAVSDTRQIAGLAGNPDWQLAKKLLVAKIQSATSLLDMPAAERRNPDLCEARYQAAQIIGAWIGEIDGTLVLHDKMNEENGDPDHLLRIG